MHTTWEGGFQEETTSELFVALTVLIGLLWPVPKEFHLTTPSSQNHDVSGVKAQRELLDSSD